MDIVMRTDGGPRLGYGHLVRSARLAAVLTERGHSLACVTRTPEHAGETFDSSVTVHGLAPGGAVEEVRDSRPVRDADVLVLDRPAVTTSDLRCLADGDHSLVAILDDEPREVCCDLLVNPHVYAPRYDYRWHGEEPEWCLGCEYAILGASFVERADTDAPWRVPPERGLVLMGGSDVENTTPSAIRAFDGFGITVDVLVGPGYENVGKIQAAKRAVDAPVELVFDPDDVAAYMLRADLAVTALGLTAYELLAMQTPFVGVPVAEDQRPKAEAFRDRGCALVLDRDACVDELRRAVRRLLADDPLRRRMRRQCESLVDTEGVVRVCDRIEAIA